jgi:plasmid stabilization system protein ParE
MPFRISGKSRVILHLFRQQPVNALKVGDAIDETISRIGKTPTAFRELEELRTKTKIYRQADVLVMVHHLPDSRSKCVSPWYHSSLKPSFKI